MTKRTQSSSREKPTSRGDAPAGLAVRQAAHAVLADVLHRKLLLDQSLERTFSDGPYKALDGRDRAFSRAIVMSTLRRLGQIDHLIDGFLSKPLPPRTEGLRIILRAGIAELLFLESQAHAALNSAVEITARAKAFRPFKGLVNALLRRAQREGMNWLKDNGFGNESNIPDWLLNSWLIKYGKARTNSIAAAILNEPALDISFKNISDVEICSFPCDRANSSSVRTLTGGRIDHLPGYENGLWWVQDLASSLPAKLIPNLSGKHVADLCAAPGGKTAQLAAGGAVVTAIDISGKRLKRLTDNLDRLKLNVDIVEADLRKWQPHSDFDAILLDAPCSATGTIRRHPDLLHTKQATDVEKLAGVQADLLGRSVSWLKPGGTLIYCTCSLQTEEGEDQIDTFLRQQAGMELDPIRPVELPGLEECVTEEGYVRALPFHYAHEEDPRLSGMDGFFVARLRKKAT
ncbi:RsmB/NOP family class I SAM-dependent RNA methyltransferase [Coralliovum pocilloporae]|uniref:RsmB/NOP family class I SAM-dependent RNA methyltransferase n=1 Tax=Coralliovum pocilloporae TaxID=3066369 RepID=UPI003306D6C3